MSEALPNWYRGIQIVLGIAAIILAFAVWIFYAFSVALMIVIFAFALMVIGLSGVASGTAGTTLPTWRRGLSIALGVISILLAILVIIFPSSGISFLIVLLAIGLFISGVIGISSGASNADLPSWHRALYIIIGAVIIIFSVIILLEPTLGTIWWIPIIPAIPFPIPVTSIPSWGLIYVNPSTGYLLLVLLLSVGLMIRGIQSIVSGARGTE